MDHLNIFNANILYLRKKHGLTMTKMAQIMGVSVQTLRKMEQGIPTPRMDCMVPLRVGQYFHISIDDLWNTVLFE